MEVPNEEFMIFWQTFNTKLKNRAETQELQSIYKEISMKGGPTLFRDLNHLFDILNWLSKVPHGTEEVTDALS